MVNAQTGEAKFVPDLSMNLIDMDCEHELYFKPNSRLVVQSDSKYESNQCIVNYYVEDNGKLKLIETQPFVKKGE